MNNDCIMRDFHGVAFACVRPSTLYPPLDLRTLDRGMRFMFDIQTKKAHISIIMKPAPGALLAARIPPTPVSPPRRMERSSIPGSCRTPRHLSGRAGRDGKRREQQPALQCDSQCARVERRKFDEGQSRPPAYFPGRSGGFRPIVHKSTEQQFFLLYTCTRILP
jgi:hypothetical protein